MPDNMLAIDPERTTETICNWIRSTVLGALHRRGTVIGLSGGIDSSVCAALCVRALGPQKVLGLFMPERDSSSDSLRLGRLVADSLGIFAELEAIGPALEAAGCYQRQVEAIREVFPDYLWHKRRTPLLIIRLPHFLVLTTQQQFLLLLFGLVFY